MATNTHRSHSSTVSSFTFNIHPAYGNRRCRARYIHALMGLSLFSLEAQSKNPDTSCGCLALRDGATDIYWDSRSVVHNGSRPETVLEKKQNFITFNKIREALPAGIIAVHKITSYEKIADLLAKGLFGVATNYLASQLVAWKNISFLWIFHGRIKNYYYYVYDLFFDTCRMLSCYIDTCGHLNVVDLIIKRHWLSLLLHVTSADFSV